MNHRQKHSLHSFSIPPLHHARISTIIYNFMKAIIEALGKTEAFMMQISIHISTIQIATNKLKENCSFPITECLPQFFKDISIIRSKYMNETDWGVLQNKKNIGHVQ